MKKQPLKVSPPRKIYRPQYPAFDEPNPLLHPDARPYPFTLRFANWAAAGGLSVLAALGSGDLQAQIVPDSLFNPFPLENARVPYMPVMFGTGMPERLGHEETLQAIRKAFAEAGLQPEENVWLGDSVGVYLDGYDAEEGIGFVFMDYRNMDKSFVDERYYEMNGGRNRKAKPWELSDYVSRAEGNAKSDFNSFIEDKEKYLKRITSYNDYDYADAYAAGLQDLAPEKKNREAFFALRLTYRAAQIQRSIDESKHWQKTAEYIINRLPASDLKIALLGRLASLRTEPTDAFAVAIDRAFEKLKTVKSDDKFAEDFITFSDYIDENYGFYYLRNDKYFQTEKANVMRKYPLQKWAKKTDSIKELIDRKMISLSEAQAIDRRNKNGKQFIAPISGRDKLTIIPESFRFEFPEEFEQRNKELLENFNRENGMTPEIFAARRAEYSKISDKYGYKVTKDLEQEERQKMYKKQREEQAAVKAKYEAMEQLTDERRAWYKVRFDEMQAERRRLQKEYAEQVKADTLRKLEDEVKRYIAWARSQTGG